MAVGVKLLHIVTNNNLIKVVNRFVPVSIVAATKVYRFLVVGFGAQLTGPINSM